MTGLAWSPMGWTVPSRAAQRRTTWSHSLGLLARHHGSDVSVVQRYDLASGQVAHGLHFGHQRGEHDCLGDPVIAVHRMSDRSVRCLLLGEPMAFQDDPENLSVDLLRVPP